MPLGRGLVALLLAALLTIAVVGCVGQDSETAAPDSGRVFDPGEDDDFFDPPEKLVPDDPGKLVWTEPLDAPAGADAWRILYTSESPEGRIILVSGLLASPEDDSRDRPVVVQSTGTVGLGDDCTFSTAPNLPEGTTLQLNVLILLAVNQGWVGVVTDLPGLNTPGTHTYLVGESNGRAFLDAARAAGQLKNAHAGRRVAFLGGSEGAHGALFAGQVASDYAPELELEGTAAWSPASHLDRYLAPGADPVIPGFFAMLALGIGEAHGLNPAAGLDQHDQDLLGRISRACTGAQKEFPTIGELAERLHERGFVERGPFERQPWRGLLRDQNPGQAPAGAPVLIVQGDEDEVVPPSWTSDLFGEMCNQGDEVELEIVAGAGHVGADPDFNRAAGEVTLPWLEDRFAGEPAPSNCLG